MAHLRQWKPTLAEKLKSECTRYSRGSAIQGLLHGHEMMAFRRSAQTRQRGAAVIRHRLYLCPDIRPQDLWIRVGIPVTDGRDNIL